MIMPDSRVSCLHELVGSTSDEVIDCDFEESDPSGRYRRYKDVLGRGAFKTVYRAFDGIDGIEVAWNQVQLQDVLHTSEDLERLYSEVHLLKTLKHKNIIKFYHSWVDTSTKNLNFITEVFTSGTLRQYRKRHRHVDMRAVKNWSRQILRGLLYLHSHDPPIIHRDLKCDNVFINGNQGEVKIGDLGLAAILCQAHAAHSVIGTPEFMAPELYEEEYTELVDIYSFGMCLLEMVTFEYPYSECSNAAQIYKKVTSGKKPAALYKVKDPELRQFVEKCIASASSRLPARELLMDPFIRCEGDRDPVEPLPLWGKALVSGDDMDDLVALLGKGSCKPQFVSRNFAAESFSSLPEIGEAPKLPAVAHSKSRTLDELSTTKSTINVLPSSLVHDDKASRNMDFRVKGKRRENDTVYLQLRIADTEGHIRVIHFPFDAEGDTAMSVASEMIGELDLTDQDVTKIAELIDAAVLVMVPEWKPGVAIDEACVEGEDTISNTPRHRDHSRLHGTTDPLSAMSSESSLVDQTPHGLTYCFDSSEAMTIGSTFPEGTMYGRFEEVTYLQHKLECPHVGEISSASSEELLNWEPTDDSTVPTSPVSNNPVLNNSSATLYCATQTAPNNAKPAFNELIESKKNLALGSSVQTLSYHGERDDHCHGVGDNLKNEKLQSGHNGQDIYSALDFSASLDDDDNRELVTQEFKVLALRYEQEVRELQRKHEEALLELRNRQRQHNRATVSSPTMQQLDTVLRTNKEW